MKNLYVIDLGIIKYQESLDLQGKLVNARLDERILDTLFLLEHPHVYTMGTLARDIPHSAIFKIPEDELAKKEVEIYHINRGGHVTYHGPGQLVGYAIRSLENGLRDFAAHMDGLEEVMLRTAADFGVHAYKKGQEYDPRTKSVEKFRGAWYDIDGKPHKIGAIGAGFIPRGEKYATQHGFAFNVNTDLSYFNHIDPCGLSNIGATSLKEIVGKEVSLSEVKDAAERNFADIFQCQVQRKTLSDVLELL